MVSRYSKANDRVCWAVTGVTLCALLSSKPLTAGLIQVATYRLDANFSADEPGAPALTPIGPAGDTGWSWQQVPVQLAADDSPPTPLPSRTVFAWNAERRSPSQDQAGLQLNVGSWWTGAGGLGLDKYAVELVFRYTTVPPVSGTYTRMINAQAASSDYGLYSVDSGLHLFGSGGYQSRYPPVTDDFYGGLFHRLVMVTDAGSVDVFVDDYISLGEPSRPGVDWYIPGNNPVDSVPTSIMNITSGTLRFFLDNASEYEKGQLAYLAIHRVVADGNGGESAFQISSDLSLPEQMQAVPEPNVAAGLWLGLMLWGGLRLRKYTV